MSLSNTAAQCSQWIAITGCVTFSTFALLFGLIGWILYCHQLHYKLASHQCQNCRQQRSHSLNSLAQLETDTKRYSRNVRFNVIKEQNKNDVTFQGASSSSGDQLLDERVEYDEPNLPDENKDFQTSTTNCQDEKHLIVSHPYEQIYRSSWNDYNQLNCEVSEDNKMNKKKSGLLRHNTQRSRKFKNLLEHDTKTTMTKKLDKTVPPVSRFRDQNYYQVIKHSNNNNYW